MHFWARVVATRRFASLRVVAATFAGFAAGAWFREGGPDVSWLGDAFIALLRLFMGPVVFCCVVAGVGGLPRGAALWGLLGKALMIYLASMAVFCFLGLTFGVAFFGQLAGVGLPGATLESRWATAGPNSFVPPQGQHFLESLITGNMLHLLGVAIFVGVVAHGAGDAGQHLVAVARWGAAILIRCIQMILKLAPLAVFVIAMGAARTYGLDVLLSLGGLLIGYVLVVGLGMAVVYGCGLRVSGLRPSRFFEAMLPVQACAFSTASSAATLPLTMEVSESRLGISRDIASFLLPLGATMNMNGLAAYIGISVAFAAHLAGHTLQPGEYLQVVFVAATVSIGVAGVPAAAVAVLPLVLAPLGLPLECVAMVACVDRLLDMVSTAVNVTGDAFSALVIARLAGQHDLAVYSRGKDETPDFTMPARSAS